MRGANHVIKAKQHVLFCRLLGIYIKSRALELAGFKRLGHGSLIHQATTGAVDQVSALLDFGNTLGAEQIGGFVGFGQVKRDEIGTAQQFVKVFNLAHTNRLGALFGKERIISNHLHLQPDRPAGHHRADIARADQPQRFTADLGAHEFGFLPLAGLRAGIRRRNLPRHGKHHRNRVLGGGDRVAKRRVHHHDPLG